MYHDPLVGPLAHIPDLLQGGGPASWADSTIDFNATPQDLGSLRSIVDNSHLYAESVEGRHSWLHDSTGHGGLHFTGKTSFSHTSDNDESDSAEFRLPSSELTTDSRSPGRTGRRGSGRDWEGITGSTRGITGSTSSTGITGSTSAGDLYREQFLRARGGGAKTVYGDHFYQGGANYASPIESPLARKTAEHGEVTDVARMPVAMPRMSKDDGLWASADGHPSGDPEPRSSSNPAASPYRPNNNANISTRSEDDLDQLPLRLMYARRRHSEPAMQVDMRAFNALVEQTLDSLSNPGSSSGRASKATALDSMSNPGPSARRGTRLLLADTRRDLEKLQQQPTAAAALARLLDETPPRTQAQVNMVSLVDMASSRVVSPLPHAPVGRTPDGGRSTHDGGSDDQNEESFLVFDDDNDGDDDDGPAHDKHLSNISLHSSQPSDASDLDDRYDRFIDGEYCPVVKPLAMSSSRRQSDPVVVAAAAEAAGGTVPWSSPFGIAKGRSGVGSPASPVDTKTTPMTITEEWDLLLKQFEGDWERRQRLCRRRTGMRDKNPQVVYRCIRYILSVIIYPLLSIRYYLCSLGRVPAAAAGEHLVRGHGTGAPKNGKHGEPRLRHHQHR
jgi:hypothetical protein